MAKRMDSLPCRSGHGSDDIDLAKGICEGCRVERVRRQLEDLREGRRRGRPHGMTAEEILSAFSERSADGCLIWLGATDSGGYGQLVFQGAHIRVHSLAWLTFKGPLVEGMVLDHECHNKAALSGVCPGGACTHRRCFDPEHLAMKSHKENINSSPLGRSWKTHCVNGHEFNEENTIFLRTRNNSRCCRICTNKRKREAYRNMYWTDERRQRHMDRLRGDELDD